MHTARRKALASFKRHASMPPRRPGAMPLTSCGLAACMGSQLLQVDAAGNGIALLTCARSDSGIGIAASRYTAASNEWRSPIELSGPRAEIPDLDFDGAGNATAVWFQKAGGARSDPVDTVDPAAASRARSANGSRSRVGDRQHGHARVEKAPASGTAPDRVSVGRRVDPRQRPGECAH